MQKNKNQFIALTAFLCAVLFSGISFGEENTAASPNPTPNTLSISRLDESTAQIRAQFPQLKPGSTTEINVGKENIVFSDNGRNGDEKANDGIFSVKTAFDFEAFSTANKQLAEAETKEPHTTFASASRQISGTRKIVNNGESLTVHDVLNNGRASTFKLPLDSSQIKIGQTLTLPTGLPLGIPSAASAGAAAMGPTSIPHSIMITNTTVVEDPIRTWSCPTPGAPVGNPHGEWTFWQLMENINNGTSSTSDYIKALFKHWTSVQVVNSHAVLDRPNVYQHIIEQWEIRSGGLGAPLLASESPFRLLAIALRLDLRGADKAVYGGGEAGEGRFVFSLHDGHCNPMGKTLILEYKVPIAGCVDVRTWAQKWKGLASSGSYNNDLASLTDVFSAAGANPSAPNKSALGQARTNELLPGSPLWELREFVLPRSGGFLAETTVKQEPDVSHNNSPLLADYVNTNWPQLVGPPAAQHEITPLHLGNPFLAGAAPAPLLWNVPNPLLSVPVTPSPISAPPATVRDDALFQLGLNTCSGCHTLETGTSFAHIHYNTPPGAPAILSGFLTGTSLPDPRNGALMRSFNDLQRRANDLDAVAAMACPSITSPPFPVGNIALSILSTPQAINAVH